MANSIALNAVYDHILTNYVSKDVKQTETHKKSELRGIYNSIVKINKDSPLFLLKDDTQDEAHAVELKEEARALRSTIYGLSNIDEDVLDQKSAYSTNESAVTASLAKGATEEGLDAFTLGVSELASAQVNTGKYLPSGLAQLSPGSYSFNVRVGEQKYEFQYSIGKNDLNRDVQDKLSRLINKAGVNLRAAVLTDSRGYSALEITAAETGTATGKDYRFQITEDEISTNSGTLDYFGLDNTTAPARNAAFDINGTAHNSASNHIMVGGAFELTLHDVTGEIPATIGTHNDIEAFLDHVSQLTRGYNEFLDSIDKHDNAAFKRAKIRSEAQGIAREHLSSLQEDGIRIEQDGHIAIDKDRLAEIAHGEDGIAHFHTINDFAKALIDKSKEISLDPMKYVDRPVVNYKNPGHGFVAPYVTSEYSGMLFSGYC